MAPTSANANAHAQVVRKRSPVGFVAFPICAGYHEVESAHPTFFFEALLIRTRPTMATYITSDCINCGACEPECPNEAISEGDEIYLIDPELCTECVGFHDHEACQAVCPVECCLPDPKHDELEKDLLARALKLHPDNEALQKRAEENNFPSRFRK
jgi:ferredoxin